MANLIGTAPNQVPTNGSLGTAAFIDISQILGNIVDSGDFTVTLTGSTSGDAPLAYGTMAYVKIDKLVTVTGRLQVASTSSPVGNIQINGLPFTLGNLVGKATDAGNAVTYYDASTTTYSVEPMVIEEAGTTISIKKDASTVGAGDHIYFSFSYVSE